MNVNDERKHFAVRGGEFDVGVGRQLFVCTTLVNFEGQSHRLLVAGQQETDLSLRCQIITRGVRFFYRSIPAAACLPMRER